MVHIRPALPSDLPLLPEIERVAASLFAEWSERLGFDPNGPIHVNSVENFRRGMENDRLIVAADASDVPVGFALMLAIDNNLHLEELDVLPEHGRKGIGRALVMEVCEKGRREGYKGVTLSTFRDVPWNGPFYTSCGFQVLQPADLTHGLMAIVESERAVGLRVELRQIMRLVL